MRGPKKRRICAASVANSGPSSAARSGSVIGIELPSGIKVTVDAMVDADALSRVIGVLTR